MEHILDLGSLILFYLCGLLPLMGIAYLLGKRRALSVKSAAGGVKMNASIDYYGWYALIWLGGPPMILSVLAALLHIFGLVRVPGYVLVSAVLTTAAAGLAIGLKGIRPELHARIPVERAMRIFLLAASLISIFTTIGIVISILFEALKFFSDVSIIDFLTGTTWNPDTAFYEGAGRSAEGAAEAAFGSVPIFWGTFMITIIAMLVAVPIGLLSAVYMSEYASNRVRNAAKPMLEVLAGIPTVVYGFFAAITVAPFIVKLAEVVGLEADYQNALAPGLVMGIMIIPLVSSLSDDVINAVPQNLREGSLALGTTTSETTKNVILPAALPGIVSAFLLAVSRALGETMIVVMAAGLAANLSINPLESMTTVTVRIVDALTGDTSFDSLETLSAFALGLVLFLVTLMLNLIATIVIRKFRQRYE